MTSIRTPVWRISGLRGNEPGLLELSNGRLIYDATDGMGFDVPLAEVSGVTFPWYYFNGGFKLEVGGEEFRFSFIEPHNDYADINSGRAIGKQWKIALGR